MFDVLYLSMFSVIVLRVCLIFFALLMLFHVLSMLFACSIFFPVCLCFPVFCSMFVSPVSLCFFSWRSCCYSAFLFVFCCFCLSVFRWFSLYVQCCSLQLQSLILLFYCVDLL